MSFGYSPRCMQMRTWHVPVADINGVGRIVPPPPPKKKMAALVFYGSWLRRHQIMDGGTSGYPQKIFDVIHKSEWPFDSSAALCGWGHLNHRPFRTVPLGISE